MTAPGHPLRLTVNGVEHEVVVEPRRLLADILRDDLALTGTHLGCEHGVCGACTVLLDGEPVRSCLIFGVQADQCELTTIEGLAAPGNLLAAPGNSLAAPGNSLAAPGNSLAAPGKLHPLQEAFRTHHALQCGFCTPGMVLTALDLLAHNPDPTETEVRDGLAGNICRCTGYMNIVAAVLAAAEERPS